MAGECDMAGFYLELGCTAEPRADNSTGCPDSFTCPDLHPDPTMCYYRYVNISIDDWVSLGTVGKLLAGQHVEVDASLGT